jgi:ribosomal protein L31
MQEKILKKMQLKATLRSDRYVTEICSAKLPAYSASLGKQQTVAMGTSFSFLLLFT